MPSSLYSCGSKIFENALHSLTVFFSCRDKPKIRFDYTSNYSVTFGIDFNSKALEITRIDDEVINFREIGIPIEELDKFTVLSRGFHFALYIPGLDKPISILNPHSVDSIKSIYVEQVDVSLEDFGHTIQSTSSIINCLAKIAEKNHDFNDTHFFRELNRYGYYRSELCDDEIFYWYPLCGVCLAATPKCASTTVLSLLSDDYSIKRGLDYTWSQMDPHGHGNLKGLVHLSELSEDQIYSILSANLESSANVALVRHPVSRLVSAYLDKVANHSHLYHLINSALNKMGKKNDSEAILFDEFVEAIATFSPYDFESHIKPIALTVHPRLVKYSHIIKVETFAADLKRFSSDVGILATSRASAQLHQTASRRADINVSSRSKQLIEKIYQLDYEAFGY